VRYAVVLLSAIVVLPACDDCNDKTSPTAASASASATPPPASASASASPSAAPSASVGASGKMAHCPDAVTGAKTAIADVPGGVTVTVTGSDAASIADIRARIAALLDAQKNQGPGVHHTGTGEGGGLLGRCPIVLKDTTVVAADVENGTKITVTTKNADEVDWLRRETRDRQQDLQEAASPAGAGKMSHCPSAAQGATTTIKNTADGVSIAVTSTAQDVTNDIRVRAKHLAEIAAEDAGAAAPTHTGEGGGGGNVGRCPVVLKDTTIKVKDIQGGTQIDVKPKAKADVAKLQDETKERAAKFQLPGAAGSASATPAASGSAKPGK
jgi:TusA-related sulfurtransferase